MVCELKKEFVRVSYAGKSSWACVVVCRGVRYMLTRKTFFQGANYPADALVMVFYKGYATLCSVEIHYVDRKCGEVAAMIGFQEGVNENRHCVLPQCLFVFMLLCRNLLRFVDGFVLRNVEYENGL